MEIISAKYIKDILLDKIVCIQAVFNGKEWSVPLDPDNTSYSEIMRQVDAGELTIEPADE